MAWEPWRQVVEAKTNYPEEVEDNFNPHDPKLLINILADKEKREDNPVRQWALRDINFPPSSTN